MKLLVILLCPLIVFDVLTSGFGAQALLSDDAPTWTKAMLWCIALAVVATSAARPTADKLLRLFWSVCVFWDFATTLAACSTFFVSRTVLDVDWSTIAHPAARLPASIMTAIIVSGTPMILGYILKRWNYY